MKMSNEQVEYFKSIVKGNATNKIIDLFFNKFGILLTSQQVKHQKRKYNLQSGVDTTFKKNQVAHNKKNIGDEFVSKNGYTFVKIAEPNTWTHKQIYVYELHYGKIPKNHSVVFLDMNKSNFDIDNLKLVSNATKLTAKNQKLFDKNKQITETGLLIAELINKKSKLERSELNERRI